MLLSSYRLYLPVPSVISSVISLADEIDKASLNCFLFCRNWSLVNLDPASDCSNIVLKSEGHSPGLTACITSPSLGVEVLHGSKPTAPSGCTSPGSSYPCKPIGVTTSFNTE